MIHKASKKSIQKIAVIGSGTLGSQISWHCAFKGKDVVCYDTDKNAPEKSKLAFNAFYEIYKQYFQSNANDLNETLSRLTFSENLNRCVSNVDLVIECISENLEQKIDCFKHISDIISDSTLLLSNTSTYCPSEFIQNVKHPNRFCCFHFANIIWETNIVEIMPHQKTSEETLIDLLQFSFDIDMVPIPVSREQKGYICNSLLIPLLNAAQSLIRNGISTPEYIDKTYMIVNKGCGTGPCGIMDIIGLETVSKIFNDFGLRNKNEEMLNNAKYLNKQYVEKGRLGLWSGRGYYDYPNPTFQKEGFLELPNYSDLLDLLPLFGRKRSTN